MAVNDPFNQFLYSGTTKLNGSQAVIQASFNSQPQDVRYCYGLSVTAIYSGTATGTFKLQASNDHTESPVAGSWADVSGTELALTTGSPIIWNLIDFMPRWFRFVYTRTAGDLDGLTVTMTGKG